MRQKIVIFFCFISVLSYSQDSAYLKVHFLYGSKPLKKYKATEQKWFGGILGGHVGIEGDDDKIVNFLPKGKFHWLIKKIIDTVLMRFIHLTSFMQFLAAIQIV